MAKPNEKDTQLAKAVRMFAEIADDPDADPEDRRRSRAILKAHYSDDDSDTEARRARAAARPPMRIVTAPPAPAPPPARPVTAQDVHEAQMLSRLEGRVVDASATRARVEGSGLVLEAMSPEHAAARARELASKGARQPRDISVDKMLSRLHTTEQR